MNDNNRKNIKVSVHKYPSNYTHSHPQVHYCTIVIASKKKSISVCDPWMILFAVLPSERCIADDGPVEPIQAVYVNLVQIKVPSIM